MATGTVGRTERSIRGRRRRGALFARIAFAPLLLASVTLTGSAALAQKEPEPACARACMEKWVDTYLEAMRDGRVDAKLFARDIKFTENGVQLPLGDEGLWHGMSGIGKYKFYVPDIETQQVAFIGTVRENGKGPNDGQLVAIALRLKIRNDRITEIEQLAIRRETPLTGGGASPPPTPPRMSAGERIESLGAPHPIYRETIPAAERATREELVKQGNYYFAGLQRNDGKGYYPFTDDCLRLENGNDAMTGYLDPTTGTRPRMTCKRQFEVGLKGIVSRIRDRRFVAVDRERGIVFAFGFFDHHNINWTWQLAELFRIEKGQIRRIEAVLHRAPFGMNSGWSTYEQGMSEEIQSVR